MPGPMLRRDLEKKADELRIQMQEDEVQLAEMRHAGRQMLQLADTILSGVEQSLASDGAGGMTARARLGPSALPPIGALRPETADQ